MQAGIFRLLEDAMKALPSLHRLQCTLSAHSNHFDIRMIVKEQKVQHGEALAVYVDLVLADLPYNISCVRDEENSTHDVFSSTLIEAMLKLCGEMLRPGAHMYIFCSVLQSGSQYRVLYKKVEG